MKDETLEYIRKHVTKWPDEALDEVRLDADSEICFSPVIDYDFYPIDEFYGKHKPFAGFYQTGKTYTREQWEQPETDLTKLDKPFGELDRATQLKLVEHVLDGGGVEWIDLELMFHSIAFKSDTKYRAI